MNSSSRTRLRKADVVTNKGQLANLPVFLYFLSFLLFIFFLFLLLRNFKFRATSICLLPVLILTEKSTKTTINFSGHVN